MKDPYDELVQYLHEFDNTCIKPTHLNILEKIWQINSHGETIKYK